MRRASSSCIMPVPFFAMMKTSVTRVFRLSLFLALCAVSLPLVAQQRPLRTQPAEVLKPGELQISFGVEFLQDAEFPHSGLTGDFTRAGILDLHLGVSSAVELQLQGTVRNFLSVDRQAPALITPQLDRNGTSTSDVGDFSLAAKIQFLRETKARPSLAVRVGFKMPNSDEQSGIGLNTTDVFFTFLGQKHVGKLNLFVNAGVGILEAPGASFTQNDVVLYGVGAVHPVTPKVNIVAEVNGQWSTRSVPVTSELVGTGSRSQARFGLQIFVGGLRWDVAGIAGLTGRDADSGISLGVTKVFNFGRGFPR